MIIIKEVNKGINGMTIYRKRKNSPIMYLVFWEKIEGVIVLDDEIRL